MSNCLPTNQQREKRVKMALITTGRKFSVLLLSSTAARRNNNTMSLSTSFTRTILFFIVLFLAIGHLLHQYPSLRQQTFASILGVITRHTNEKNQEFRCKLIRETHGARNVLEIGAGAGANLECIKCHRYSAVEPNPFLTEKLEQQMKLLLEPKGIELGKVHVTSGGNMSSIESNSMDAVIMTHVLCSVHPGEVESVLREIHRVLKKGGKFVFMEHVRSWRNPLLKRIQDFIAPVWSVLFDGCSFKDTWNDLDWMRHELNMDVDYERAELSFMPLGILKPHVAGVAIKK